MPGLKRLVAKKLEFTACMLFLAFMDAIFVIGVLAIARLVAETSGYIWPNSENGFFQMMETISSTVGCVLYILFVILTLIISVTYLKDEIKDLSLRR